MLKVGKGAKIRNRYNQVPHLTQDTNGKVTDSQIDTTNESQEVSPFPAGDHKAHINRYIQKQNKHKTEKKFKRSLVLKHIWFTTSKYKYMLEVLAMGRYQNMFLRRRGGGHFDFGVVCIRVGLILS